MKWEEFIHTNHENDLHDWALTNIECPKCGKEVYRYTLIVHTSNPPKHTYKCFGCGWKDIA